MLKKKTPVRDYIRLYYNAYIAEYVCKFIGHRWQRGSVIMNWINGDVPNYRCVCTRCNAHTESIKICTKLKNKL